jgi:hypothetical protein
VAKAVWYANTYYGRSPPDFVIYPPEEPVLAKESDRFFETAIDGKERTLLYRRAYNSSYSSPLK